MEGVSMKIFGYGEDAATYWALTTNLKKILEVQGDKSSPLVVFYRPSFGRGKHGWGEFDAIIGTEQAIYLVESKWFRSSECARKGTIEVRREQVVRHAMFQWVYKKWHDGKYCEWKVFREKNNNAFKKEHNKTKKELPNADNLLACNLMNLCSKLSKCGTVVKNILLFLHADLSRATPELDDHMIVKYKGPKLDGSDGFKVIRVLYPEYSKEDYYFTMT